MYLNLLSKILRNTICEVNAPTPTPLEMSEIEEILDSLLKEGIDLNISKDNLVAALQYTKKSRNIHTYVSEKSLDNIKSCVDLIEKDCVPGDLIDCGVLRGGTSIYMAGILKSYGIKNRNLIVADSFEGLPPPCIEDGVFSNEFWYRFSKNLPMYFLDCYCDIEQVKNNFKLYGLLSEQVIFKKGWFSKTLDPKYFKNNLSLIRIDADWYQSTLDVLESCYPKLSKGGIVIIDDYKLVGCRKAVDEFRISNKIFDEIKFADKDAGVIWWRK